MENRHIIIDNGSGFCKAGFSGEFEPRTVFPSIFGSPKNKLIMITGHQKDFYIGLDAEDIRGVLNLNYPIKEGNIIDWSEMENIWKYIFTNELRVDPSEHYIMISDSPMNPKINKEKLALIMFEEFNIPGLFFADQVVLPLYSIGKNIGIVADIGDAFSHFGSVFEGYSLRHSIIRMELAGRDVTDYLIRIFYEEGVHLTTTAEREIAKDIKEQTCYIALDFENEKNYYKSIDYEMPDGNKIFIKDQRFRAPEILFQPEICGKYTGGIAQNFNESINRTDRDLRKELYENIVLSGGSTMFPGFTERFTNEIKNLAPYFYQSHVEVTAEPERKLSSWIGCSILSSILPEEYWISRDEYNESGNSILHRKCF